MNLAQNLLILALLSLPTLGCTLVTPQDSEKLRIYSAITLMAYAEEIIALPPGVVFPPSTVRFRDATYQKGCGPKTLTINGFGEWNCGGKLPEIGKLYILYILKDPTKRADATLVNRPDTGVGIQPYKNRYESPVTEDESRFCIPEQMIGRFTFKEPGEYWRRMGPVNFPYDKWIK